MSGEDLDQFSGAAEAIATITRAESNRRALSIQFLASLGQKLGAPISYFKLVEKLRAVTSFQRPVGLDIKLAFEQPEFGCDEEYGTPLTVPSVRRGEQFRVGIRRAPKNEGVLWLVFAVEELPAH